MKTMTCSQLGGACELEFHADTWEDMQAQSHAHGTEMYKKQDSAHMDAVRKMQQMMQDPDAMQIWMAERKAQFDALFSDS